MVMAKKFGIVANASIKGTPEIAKKVLEFLEPEHECILAEEIAGELNMAKRGVPLEKLDTEIVIAIGGDGTILRTLQHTECKILGVNAGVLGFLTEISSKNLEDGLKRLVEDDYVVDERIKLKTLFNGERLVDAVNEAVLHTAQIAKIQSYQVFVDEYSAEKIRADGIIIATPTGSTCYAMSAGGPILDPKVNGFVITPIAPFKLAARPLVVSSNSIITIELVESQRNSTLVLDGQKEIEVSTGDIIKFGLSENKAQFIRFDSDFYKRVSEKLSAAF
jgi:NAD+ kinase